MIMGKKYLKGERLSQVQDLGLLCEDDRCVVIFGYSRIILTSVEPHSYVDNLPFVKTRENFLGGQIGLPEPPGRADQYRSFVLVSVPSGLIRIDVKMKQHVEEIGGRRILSLGSNGGLLPKNLTKRKLEQLVFFNTENNPLEFVLTETDYKDLDGAIEELLREILDSTSEYLDPSLDLLDYFIVRQRHVDELLNLLDSSDVLQFLSPYRRFSIAEQMEKLVLGSKMWSFTSMVLSDSSSHNLFLDILRTTLEEYYRSQNYSIRDDLIRHFFRYHVTDIFEVFSAFLSHSSMRSVQSSKLDEEVSSLLMTICVLLIEALSDTLDYRAEKDSLLTIGDHPSPRERWTSRKSLLDYVHILLEQVYTRLSVPERQLPSQMPSQRHTKMTINDESSALVWWDIYMSLADAFFFMTTERLKYLLESSFENVAKDKELRSMREWSKTIRTRIMHVLVNNTRRDAAFRLAEKYLDFHSLIELCYTYFATFNEISPTLEEYIDRFGGDFLKSLFAWYLETGRFKDLVDQPQQYAPLLQEFLLEEDKSELLWITQVSGKNYRQAADTLLKVSGYMNSTDHQMTVLSLAKLSALAEVSSGLDTESSPLLNTVEDYLDVCRIQVHKTDELLSLLGLMGLDPLKTSIDIQYEQLRKHHSIKPFLATTHTTIDHFGQIVHQLLSHEVISSRDLIDYLTSVSYRNSDALIPNSVLALEAYLKTFHVGLDFHDEFIN
jgi:hypothetical protein